MVIVPEIPRECIPQRTVYDIGEFSTIWETDCSLYYLEFRTLEHSIRIHMTPGVDVPDVLTAQEGKLTVSLDREPPVDFVIGEGFVRKVEEDAPFADPNFQELATKLLAV